MQRALQTARRVSASVSGSGVEAVQKVHPPAAVISMALTDPSLDPSPEEPAAMQSYVTCVPTEAFGRDGGGPWCSALKTGGSVAGDGRLTSYMMELDGPGWGDTVQVRRCSVLRAACFVHVTQNMLAFLGRRGEPGTLQRLMGRCAADVPHGDAAGQLAAAAVRAAQRGAAAREERVQAAAVLRAAPAEPGVCGRGLPVPGAAAVQPGVPRG